MQMVSLDSREIPAGQVNTTLGFHSLFLLMSPGVAVAVAAVEKLCTPQRLAPARSELREEQGGMEELLDISDQQGMALTRPTTRVPAVPGVCTMAVAADGAICTPITPIAARQDWLETWGHPAPFSRPSHTNATWMPMATALEVPSFLA